MRYRLRLHHFTLVLEGIAADDFHNVCERLYQYRPDTSPCWSSGITYIGYDRHGSTKATAIASAIRAVKKAVPGVTIKAIEKD